MALAARSYPPARSDASRSGLTNEELLQLAELPLVLRRCLPLQLGEAGQQRALLVGHCRRDAYADVHVVVAASAALQELHAFAAQAEDLAGLGAGGDLQRLGAVDRVGGQLRAEGGLRHRDGVLAVDVVVAALELLMLADGDEDVEVPGRSAVDAPLPFAAHAEARAVVDAGRDLHGDLLLLAYAARSVAVRAGVLDHPSGAAALRAGAGHCEEALGVADLAAAGAAGARHRLRARLGAVAGADVAGDDQGNGERDVHAEHRLFEFKRQVLLEVDAAVGPIA